MKGHASSTRDAVRRIPSLALVVATLLPALLAGYACGGSHGGPPFDPGGSSSGGGASGGGASSGALGDGGLGFDASFSGSSSGAGSSGGQPTASSAKGTFTAQDCSGCTFPPLTATSCASSAPAIRVVYPNDGVLVPPNMNVMSVQWTPFGGYTTFEVDFSNAITDTRVITRCATQTMDTSQPPVASGGCDLELDPKVWTLLEAANRGGAPVTVTVRGTTNGTCATTSTNSVKMSFAEEDLLGDIYYWKSTVATTGTGGQIWVKSFGDGNPEQQITGPGGWVLALATCNGCHALSRDGQRMVVYSDDADSDDEYADLSGSLIDMKAKATLGTAVVFLGIGGQPPGFSTLSPTHSLYLTSDGLATPPTNVFALWPGNTGTQPAPVTFGNAGDRPTMPDWSADGKSVVYVLPTKVANWGASHNDDDHVFGGSLYTLPYNGNSQFGTPTAFLKSQGENNYYPSYSPDGQFIVFDRAPASTAVSAIDGCTGTPPHVVCPNDSFSNPAARLELTSAIKGSKVIDLENANGSPAASPRPLSNSWPRWSPFVQTYRGNRLLWVAFSSTRDYGVRVRNHQSGMYQCYPPDSEEEPGASHGTPFDPLCQQPKLWMAAINLSETSGGDPSFPAFYLPFQDIATHNHTPQWTQQVVNKPPPPPDAGACIMSGASCATNPGACCAPLACGGSGTCVGAPPQ